MNKPSDYDSFIAKVDEVVNFLVSHLGDEVRWSEKPDGERYDILSYDIEQFVLLASAYQKIVYRIRSEEVIYYDRGGVYYNTHTNKIEPLLDEAIIDLMDKIKNQHFFWFEVDDEGIFVLPNLYGPPRLRVDNF